MSEQRDTNKISKADLAKLIADKMETTYKNSQRFIDSFLEVLTENLQQKKEIVISGFIKIAVKKRAKRIGRHPQTGKEMIIPEKEVVQVKVGKKLNQSIES